MRLLESMRGQNTDVRTPASCALIKVQLAHALGCAKLSTLKRIFLNEGIRGRRL